MNKTLNSLRLLVIPGVIFILVSLKADKPAYKIFTSKGHESNYDDLLHDAKKADIVFFGEQHNDPICHWLEYELACDLYRETCKNLIIGAEMFETDNQLLLDEYLRGNIQEKNFEAEAKLWPNYKTDYKPLLTLARDSGIIFVATNIPRRYATLVNNKGFEGLQNLDPQAKALIAPLPVIYDPELPGYKKILESMGDDAKEHASDNIPKAQAIKDATMAWSILSHYQKGKVFLHFNGSYHSDNYEGIVWYLKQANPNLKIMTISSEEQADLSKLPEKSEGIADYILVVPESMTKTR
ncbi:MAG: ChaN family lipoprotein [Bacteroidales bacterium]